MELLDLITKRRSIRKYQHRQIPRAALQKIIQAGLYVPTFCAIFTPTNFLYNVPDAFCSAENMVLEARQSADPEHQRHSP